MWATCDSLATVRFPIWSCSRWGLPCRGCCHPRGALLPHHFTLAGTACAALRRYLSVALSVGSRPPGVTWHRALWSPDFPPCAYAHSDCLADSGGHHSTPSPGACLSIPRGRDRGRFRLRRGGADAVGSTPNKEATTMHEAKSARSLRVGLVRGVCGVARLGRSTRYVLRRAPCTRSLAKPTRF